MKKALWILCCLLAMVNLFACKQEAYPYIYDLSEVESIQLVMFEEKESDIGHLPIRVVKELSESEQEECILCLESVSWYRTKGAPKWIACYTPAIRINYENGDFEIINSDGRYTCIDGHINASGYCMFEEEEFAVLLRKFQ